VACLIFRCAHYGATLASMNDPTFQHWLRVIEEGIRSRADLLAAILPRVAPEYVVVAAAVQALVEDVAEGPWQVLMEHSVSGIEKSDLVLRHADSAERPYHFEFKALWGGYKECTDGVERDRQKLKGVARGYVIAFAYSLHRASPSSSPRFVSKMTLDETVRWAKATLGEPVQTPPFAIRAGEVDADACLLVWKASP